MTVTKRATPAPHSGNFDITNPQHRAGAIYRLTQMGLSLPAHIVQEGKEWYDEAHGNVEASRGRLSIEPAAGVTAALSPASDWGSKNIPAIGEAASLSRRSWADIDLSHKSAVADLQHRRTLGLAGPTERPAKHPEIKAMLEEKAPHLASATIPNLLRAHRMIRGEHPLDVLTRETSPKTRAFYLGILNPRHRGSQIPIDYRMYDILANEMRPQDTKRGIERGSYTRPGMGPTNYEHAESIIGAVGQNLRERGGRRFSGATTPLRSQAVFWMGGKNYELHAPGSKESRQRPGERFSGPPRRGQAYTDERGALLPY